MADLDLIHQLGNLLGRPLKKLPNTVLNSMLGQSSCEMDQVGNKLPEGLWLCR